MTAGWTPASVLALRRLLAVGPFARDVVAGVTVGLVALPLAMAFAIASGLTPQAGIYCAIVTGFIISALGGSTLPDRRADRRLRRRRRGHRRAIRRRAACSCAR